MGLIQSILERQGIPAVSISLLREVTEKVDPPRVLYVDWPLGYPLGEPNHADLQRRIIGQALRLLEETDLPVRREAS